LKQRIEILEKQLQKNNEVISGLDRRLGDKVRQQKADSDVHQLAEPPDQKPEHLEQDVGVGVVRKPATFKTPLSSSGGGKCAAKSAKSDVQVRCI
jgi:hypothetical protein